jgi:nitroreductase
VELTDAIRHRRMVRAFETTPVDPVVVDALVDLARRSPSAGNSQGCAFVVLQGPEQTARYWDTTLPPDRRAAFGLPHLLDAPVLVLVLTRPATYVERYAEPDKADAGLGEDEAAWSVPYWWVDAGAAVEHLLLGAVDAGLGALFFGVFDHELTLLAELGVPAGWRAVGTVAMGRPLPEQPPSSAARGRKPRDEVVHHGIW